MLKKALLGLLLCSALATPALAHREDARQRGQGARIAEGVGSGDLTRREAKRLRREQRRIRRMERRFEGDGSLERSLGG